MRILMTTHRGAGHFGPLVPFAHACLRAGHDVLVAAPRSAAAMVVRAGLEHHPYDEPDPEVETSLREFIRTLPSEQAIEHMLRDVFGRLRGRAAMPAMLDAVFAWGPDVVVHEISELAGVVAAERHGVPHARIGIGLAIGDASGIGVAAPMQVALDDLRADVGVAPDPSGDRLSRSPYLTLAPPSLEFPSPLASRALRFREPVGVRPLPNWWPGRDEPLVYVSFGSAAPNLDSFPALCRAVLDAVADLPLRVLFTISDDRDPAELGPLPPLVHVERWVPQATVMPHAAAMVGHGGSGSTLMAMAAGVPLAVVPLFADQPYNARRIAQVGAGIALEGGVGAIEELPRALQALLEEPRYRRQAGRVAAEIAALPPVDDAVRVLEEVAFGRALAA
jgi:UDP:flavonoid glycosyltransferase YjiC (YdhE family)